MAGTTYEALRMDLTISPQPIGEHGLPLLIAKTRYHFQPEEAVNSDAVPGKTAS